MTTKRRTWKIADIKYIKANLTQTDKELAKHFGVDYRALRKFRLSQGLKKAGRINFVPANKGKKKEEYLSAEVIQKQLETLHSVRPKGRPMYTIYQLPSYAGWYIKTPGHHRYHYARYVWEQHHGGKLDEKQKIRYKDGNPGNCDISNLMIETNADKFNRIRPSREEASKLTSLAWAVRRTFQEFGIRNYKKAS